MKSNQNCLYIFQYHFFTLICTFLLAAIIHFFLFSDFFWNFASGHFLEIWFWNFHFYYFCFLCSFHCLILSQCFLWFGYFHLYLWFFLFFNKFIPASYASIQHGFQMNMMPHQSYDLRHTYLSIPITFSPYFMPFDVSNTKNSNQAVKLSFLVLRHDI